MSILRMRSAWRRVVAATLTSGLALGLVASQPDTSATARPGAGSAALAGAPADETAARGDPETNLALAARATFDPDHDTAGSVSSSLTEFGAGETFYLELWARTTHPTGLAIVSADLVFDPALISVDTDAPPPFVQGIFHTGLFDELMHSSGDQPGRIAALSGAYLPDDGCGTDPAGVAPHWARVAVVQFTALVAGAPSILVQPTNSPVYVVGHCGTGAIATATITYEGLNPAPYAQVALAVAGLDHAVTRTATMVLTDCGAGSEQRSVPVQFDAAGEAFTTVVDLDATVDFIQVRTGHTLPRLLPLTFTGNAAAVDFRPPHQLWSGDLSDGPVAQDGLIDVQDFAVVARNWGQTIESASDSGGDVTGDGLQDGLDFAAMVPHFGFTAEPEHDCGPELERPEPLWDWVLRGTPPGGLRPLGAAGGLHLVRVGDACWFEPGELVTHAVRVSELPEPVNGAQFLLSVPSDQLEFLGVEPGDGTDSPWNAALEVHEEIADGVLVYALVLPGTATALDAVVAEVTFRYAPPADPEPATVALVSQQGALAARLTRAADAQAVTPQLGPPVLLTLPGDFQGSGTIDVADWSGLADCLYGPDQSGAEDCCAVDFDRDGDIDLADLQGFQPLFGTP